MSAEGVPAGGGAPTAHVSEEDESASLEHMIESCVQTLKNLGPHDLASRLAVNDANVQAAIGKIDKIADALERLDAEFLEEKGHSPLTDREEFPIGQAIRVLIDHDEWTSILTSCLSWESSSLRPNLGVKLAAMRLLVAFYHATTDDGYYYEVFLLESIISYQELLAYAYGDAFISTVAGPSSSSSSAANSSLTPTVRRRRRASLRPSARVDDEMAKQVLRWWKERPSEARLLRSRATALLAAHVNVERVPAEYIADYIVETHADRGMSVSFPRVLLKRLRTELIDAYEHGTRKLRGHRVSERSCAEIRKFSAQNSEILNACRLYAHLAEINASVIRPVLQENGVDMLLRLLKIDCEDAALRWGVIELLTVLVKFRKFANELVDVGGVSVLFRLAQETSLPEFLFPMTTDCFAGLAETSIGKICQTQKPLIEDLNTFMLQQINSTQDGVNDSALGYFREALKCPANLRIFDRLQGLYKVLDAISAVFESEEFFKEHEETLTSAIGVLESYFRVHVAIAAHLARFEQQQNQQQQQPSQQTQHVRPRSNSIDSRSSFGSATSGGFHRARNLPEDKPVEIDDIAHGNDMTFLQTNFDAVLRLLSRSTWAPVETLLHYVLPNRSTNTQEQQSTEEHNEGHSQEQLKVINKPTLAEQSQHQLHPQATHEESSATSHPSSAHGATVSQANRKDGLLLLLDVVRNGYLAPAVKALQILRIVTLVPSTYKMVCEASLPSQMPIAAVINNDGHADGEEENILGISVLLDAMGTLEDREAELIVAGLEVLCNCCTPTYGDDRAQKPVRRLARDNNALMALLSLLRYDETPKYADQIRYLACLVLQGLAKDHHVAQVLETLNLTQALTKIARTEPVLVENKRIHKRLKREALKLIEHISGTDIGDVADATNKRLLRNSIVERTQISFNSRELLGLIEGHLRENGFSHAADVLGTEVKTRYGEGQHSKGASTRFLWPTKYLTGDKDAKSVEDIAIVGKKRRFGFVDERTPQKRRKLGNPAATPAKIEATLGRHQVSKVLHSNSGNSTALERIVQDYLREQHRKCLEPVTIIPPMSLLGERHECSADKKRTTGAPINVMQRLLKRETIGAHGNSGFMAQNTRYVHGRSKWVQTFRNITRNDEEVMPPELLQAELQQAYTCVAFLQPVRAGYEDMLFGTSGGDLVMRNTHTCRTFAKWNVHTHGDEQTASIKSIHVAGDRVLTLAESGAAIVSKFPASVVEAYSDDEERMYTYHLRNQNSDDDELSPLWEHDEIVNVEMDQACVSVVATIDDIERPDSAAIVYDLETGRLVTKLSHPTLSSRYARHRACFAPHDSNLVLHDGLLWDVRARRHIHKFDKLSQNGRATFRPDGTHVAIDAAVWDMRTFKLFLTCQAFGGADVIFDKASSVAYSYYPDRTDDRQASIFTVTDASDYSNITTQDLLPHRIVDLALDDMGRKLAVLTDRSINSEEWDRSCRLYEVGRSKIADGDEFEDEDPDLVEDDDDDDEEDEDDDEDDDDDDDDEDEDDLDEDGDDDDDEEDEHDMFFDEDDEDEGAVSSAHDLSQMDFGELFFSRPRPE